MFDLSIERQIEIARSIFPDIEHLGNGMCQASCPGIHLHSTKNAPRDFRIWFERGKGPHEHCVHGSCEQARSEAMSALYSLLRKDDPARAAVMRWYRDACAEYDKAGLKERPAPAVPYNPARAKRIADRCPVAVTAQWLREHSPIAIPREPEKWPKLLLESIYTPGERILVFTKFASQGQLLHIVGQQTLRVEERPPAQGYAYPPRRPSGFPRGQNNGVWFLCAPVTGEWLPNKNNIDRETGLPKPGRRHADCATRFPYLVLESDEAPSSVWLRILVQLADPIVAIYTSGGKSFHALVRVNCATEEQFNLHRQRYITRLTELGADKGAISAVRLTRLPGCLRWGSGEGMDYKPYLDPEGKPAPRMQELLYLNPAADGRCILEQICDQ